MKKRKKQRPRGCYAYCRACHEYHPVVDEEGSSNYRGSPCGQHGMDAPRIYYLVYCPRQSWPKSTDWASGETQKRTGVHFRPV